MSISEGGKVLWSGGEWGRTIWDRNRCLKFWGEVGSKTGGDRELDGE